MPSKRYMLSVGCLCLFPVIAANTPCICSDRTILTEPPKPIEACKYSVYAGLLNSILLGCSIKPQSAGVIDLLTSPWPSKNNVVLEASSRKVEHLYRVVSKIDLYEEASVA